jgi:hypothetical protein
MKIRIYKPIYGVPITYLGQHCPDQFKIIGLSNGSNFEDEYIGGNLYINKKKKYDRFLIRKS